MTAEVTTQESGDKTPGEASDTEHDPQFAPIVQLPEVQVPTHEEDEVELLKLRAKLYRFDRTGTVPEWKERGTGEVKFLRHDGNKTVRVVMRRDKTLKVCANHFITPQMELKPKMGQDRVFMYTSYADFTNEEIISECFAIKFGSVEIANQFKMAFEAAQKYVKEECKLYNGEAEREEEEAAKTKHDDEEDDSQSDELEYEDSDDANEADEEVKRKERAAIASAAAAGIREVSDKLGELCVQEATTAEEEGAKVVSNAID